MQCPKCGYEQTDGTGECLSCGIVFAKWRARQSAPPSPVSTPTSDDDGEDAPGSIIKALFFHLPTDINPVAWGFRCLVLLAMVLWGVHFMASGVDAETSMQSVWHLVDLPFHEAGHIFFRPFGRLMTSLGGSLMQVLMPAICLVVFLIKTRDPFAGSFALWWMGQNFIDLAPYINDARSLSLPLLGGNVGSHSPYGFHDWEFILRETGLIRLDHAIARLSHGIGSLLILAAVAWGGYLLYAQYQRMGQHP